MESPSVQSTSLKILAIESIAVESSIAVPTPSSNIEEKTAPKADAASFPEFLSAPSKEVIAFWLNCSAVF